MNHQISGICWNCGFELGGSDFNRESTCPRCNKYTHVCKNCRFYDPSRPNSCQEPIAEAVTDKERANFCGYFEASMEAFSGPKDNIQDDLLKAAEDLFKSS